ncbi:adenylate/guanylate cyclase family protein [Breoghania corrubedonensis]|uniref:Adenylate/guanylate cyclase family protein n=1 Tax=Breoghania corrubedonensis TaxID=665038 RepID=A0A2T5VFB8_9HYPH|nr:adenylate/guanylate cyclase domain-containing protein [Breoghania corrubedonensis]PTW62439.1 adenylate/guanylate cyclase family protein [Breoghania corrubedonensis]
MNTSERRQVSVVFCDIVQSTAMSCALEPEDLWAVINRYRETVRNTVRVFGGIICHHKGDGILCCFGYPASHEDNASRAVMAALGVLARVQQENHTEDSDDDRSEGARLRLRVGVATGEVAIVDNRADDPGGLELLGPAPSLAARLQTGAGQNMALVDETTFRLTRNDFRFTPARTVRFKGFPGPMTVYQPLGQTCGPTRFERCCAGSLTDFVNRAHEQALLCETWRRTCMGQGQLVLVKGDAGIGKSRLVRHFLEGIGDDGRREIQLQCSALHARTALHPFAVAFTRLIGLRATDTQEAMVHCLRAFLSELGIRDGYSVPLLARLVNLPAAQCLPLLNILTHEDIGQRTTSLLATCLIAMSRRYPVILVAEDLHWADTATLKLLEELSSAATDGSVMIIATFRPHPPGEAPLAGLEAARNCQSVTLDRLSRSHSARIVSSVARRAGASRLPGDWITRIVERSDGVPLFIEELTRTVIDKAGDRALLAQPFAIGKPSDNIPETLRDSLSARLDRLRLGAAGAHSPKWVAQVAACIGREFRKTTLTRLFEKVGVGTTIVPVARTDLAHMLEEAIERLVEADIICPVTCDQDITYRFKHALVHDAAYAGLWREDKRHIHARLLELLEEKAKEETPDTTAELLAHHAFKAGQPDTAARYWLAAGQRAAVRSDLREARACYEEALRLARRTAGGSATARSGAAPRTGPDPACRDKPRGVHEERTAIEMEALIALGTVEMMETLRKRHPVSAAAALCPSGAVGHERSRVAH